MKPGTEAATNAGCTCSTKTLPSKNYPYTPKSFVLYQPDCPIAGHGIFKRASTKVKKSLPTNFKIPSAEFANFDLSVLLNPE